MDDETYVYCDFKQLPGQEYYVADSRGNVEEKFRTKMVTKFPKKFLVWQAICTCGQRSDFVVFPGTINSQIYIKDCLGKRLLPFIRKHNVTTFFWSDLVSSHYSKATLEWYEANGVILVPKEANPLNCPELRPIERYWALVKRELKEIKKVIKNKEHFRREWKRASEKVAEATIKNMMEGVPKKITNFNKE